MSAWVSWSSRERNFNDLRQHTRERGLTVPPDLEKNGCHVYAWRLIQVLELARISERRSSSKLSKRLKENLCPLLHAFVSTWRKRTRQQSRPIRPLNYDIAKEADCLPASSREKFLRIDGHMAAGIEYQSGCKRVIGRGCNCAMHSNKQTYVFDASPGRILR